MIQIENDCVDCGLPCLGSSCPLTRVKHFYCDECGDETTIYRYEDKQLCISCIKKNLEPVEGSEF